MYKYFINIKSIEELKQEYRKLALKYHPDRGGNPEIFKAVTNEYNNLLKNFDTQNTDFHFENIINELIKYDNVIIEIIGNWVWVYGDTKPIKEGLKDLKFRWSSKRKMWYYGDTSGKKQYSRSSTDELRSKYGSKILDKNNKNYTLAK